MSSQGCGGSWLGFQVLSAISAVSILELAAKSGSSRMSQSPSLHIAMQLLTLKKMEQPFLSTGDHGGVYSHPNQTATKFINNFFAKIGYGKRYNSHSSIIQTVFLVHHYQTIFSFSQSSLPHCGYRYSFNMLPKKSSIL